MCVCHDKVFAIWHFWPIERRNFARAMCECPSGHKIELLFFIFSTIQFSISSYTPVYVFLLFFHTTWLVRIQSGPIWPNFADTERYVCRKNWWANVLYVNNFFTAKEPVNNAAISTHCKLDRTNRYHGVFHVIFSVYNTHGTWLLIFNWSSLAR